MAGVIKIPAGFIAKNLQLGILESPQFVTCGILQHKLPRSVEAWDKTLELLGDIVVEHVSAVERATSKLFQRFESKLRSPVVLEVQLSPFQNRHLQTSGRSQSPRPQAFLLKSAFSTRFIYELGIKILSQRQKIFAHLAHGDGRQDDPQTS